MGPDARQWGSPGDPADGRLSVDPASRFLGGGPFPGSLCGPDGGVRDFGRVRGCGHRRMRLVSGWVRGPSRSPGGAEAGRLWGDVFTYSRNGHHPAAHRHPGQSAHCRRVVPGGLRHLAGVRSRSDGLVVADPKRQICERDLCRFQPLRVLHGDGVRLGARGGDRPETSNAAVSARRLWGSGGFTADRGIFFS